MCQFKSGIILKNRCVVAPADNDSHSDLLKSLKLEDSYTNAINVFVRAELIPPDDEWWTNPEGWQIHIDQDITPNWFELDKEKYISEFRSAVKEWWTNHVLIDQKIDELNSGYYRLKSCKVHRLRGNVKVLLGSSQVSEMCDSSQVSEMCDSSQVSRMYGSSTVRDFKNFPKIKIIVPEKNSDNFEIIVSTGKE